MIPPCFTPTTIRYVLGVKWRNPGKVAVAIEKETFGSHVTYLSISINMPMSNGSVLKKTSSGQCYYVILSNVVVFFGGVVIAVDFFFQKQSYVF